MRAAAVTRLKHQDFISNEFAAARRLVHLFELRIRFCAVAARRLVSTIDTPRTIDFRDAKLMILAIESSDLGTWRRSTKS
jgi:hypothetical protein